MPAIGKDKALIFRICHIDNVPWILANGIHCRSSATFDRSYRNIGNADLIAMRADREVPIPPGGTFNDYVPFYFTSRSPMLLNIKSGRNVAAVPMQDIVVFVTSLHRLKAAAIPFVFSDRHAYLATAQFSSNLADLDRIDWAILANSDFRTDPNDPGKKERYQAETLAHRHVPIAALAGILCYGIEQEGQLKDQIAIAGCSLKVVTKPSYFF